MEKKERKSRERTLAIAFLKRTVRQIYGNLLTDLNSQYTQGHNRHPIDLTTAYFYLQNYTNIHTSPRRPQRNPYSNNNNRNNSTDTLPTPTRGSKVSFLQASQGGMKVTGTDGVVHAVQCYRYKQRGHYANQCTTQTEQETSGNSGNVQLAKIAESNDTEVEDLVSYELSFKKITTPAPDEPSNFINNNWLLLGSQSSISVYNNPYYIKKYKIAILQ